MQNFWSHFSTVFQMYSGHVSLFPFHHSILSPLCPLEIAFAQQCSCKPFTAFFSLYFIHSSYTRNIHIRYSILQHTVRPARFSFSLSALLHWFRRISLLCATLSFSSRLTLEHSYFATSYHLDIVVLLLVSLYTSATPLLDVQLFSFSLSNSSSCCLCFSPRPCSSAHPRATDDPTIARKIATTRAYAANDFAEA